MDAETFDTRDITRSFIDNILAGNAVDAEKAFGDIASVKISQAFDARKVDLAQNIYSSQEEQPAEPSTGE